MENIENDETLEATTKASFPNESAITSGEKVLYDMLFADELKTDNPIQNNKYGKIFQNSFDKFKIKNHS